MRKPLLFTIVMLFVFGAFAQESNQKENNQKKLKFTEFKILDDEYKVVYFCIDGIENDKQKEKILHDLENQDYVSFVRVYKDLYGYDRCQANIKKSITPNDIQKILIQHNVDFKFISVTIEKQ